MQVVTADAVATVCRPHIDGFSSVGCGSGAGVTGQELPAALRETAREAAHAAMPVNVVVCEDDALVGERLHKVQGLLLTSGCLPDK